MCAHLQELIDPEYPGKYRCIICCSICQNLKAWSYHAAGRRHIMRKNELLKEQQVPENTKDDTIMQNPWQMDELSIFPSRESTLDQHIQVVCHVVNFPADGSVTYPRAHTPVSKLCAITCICVIGGNFES